MNATATRVDGASAFLATRLAPLRPEPVELSRVVVPLDGSPFAERALPVATWLTGLVGASLHLAEVAGTDAAEFGDRFYLDGLARRHHAGGCEVVRNAEVGAALAGVVDGVPGRLACLATHGRDRGATIVGSVACALLDRCTQPVVLVGPHARTVTAADAPIVVAVDGMLSDEALVPVGLGWAALLGRRLVIATVAGGSAHPEAYVAALAARAARRGVDVTAEVVHDPVSVADGLVRRLDRTVALVVVGYRRRPGPARHVLGSNAARVVHDAAVPALAVPLAAPR